MILASQTTNPQQGRPSLGKELRLFLRRCQYATMDAEIVCTARLSDGLCQFRVGNDIGPVGVPATGVARTYRSNPKVSTPTHAPNNLQRLHKRLFSNSQSQRMSIGNTALSTYTTKLTKRVKQPYRILVVSVGIGFDTFETCAHSTRPLCIGSGGGHFVSDFTGRFGCFRSLTHRTRLYIHVGHRRASFLCCKAPVLGISSSTIGPCGSPPPPVVCGA